MDVLSHGGRLAVVTGAAQGLGRSIAERLARQGSAVALVDQLDCSPVQAAVEASGGVARSFVCDLADADALEATAKAIEAWRGPCGILVNNAGLFPPTPLDVLDRDLWRQVMAVNLDAPFLLSRALSGGMKTAGWGRIINIASAVIGEVRRDVAAYTASKMGLLGMTRALASDLGPHGITVNAINPGLVPTEGVAGKFGGPDAAIFEAFTRKRAIPKALSGDDIAAAVAFLAAEEAGMITGQTLTVDGGLYRT